MHAFGTSLSTNSTTQVKILKSRNLYSFHLTQVTLPSIPCLATTSPISPVVTSLSKTTTSSEYCRPTATRSPTAFSEKWRGYDPPAEASCRKSRVPFVLRLNVDRLSEGMVAVLFLISGLGREKEESLRLEMMRNLLSGCNNVRSAKVCGGLCGGRDLRIWLSLPPRYRLVEVGCRIRYCCTLA